MTKYAASLAIFALLFLAGCDGPGRTPSNDVSSVATLNKAVEDDVTGIEQGVRLAAANKRIDELQAEVEALRVNPQTIEVAMLKQRLEAIETAVYARGDDRLNQGATVEQNAQSATALKPKAARQTTPEPKTSRPATKGEAEAFVKGG